MVGFGIKYLKYERYIYVGYENLIKICKVY